MRYSDMRQLMGNISPDVVVEGLERPVVERKEKPPTADTGKILEDRFLSLWKCLGGPDLVEQHRFHPKRLWRFDFALVEKKIAFEVQGGIYADQSGHRSFTGVQRDYEKLNAATLLGWRVFQVTSMNMKDADFMQSLIDFSK